MKVLLGIPTGGEFNYRLVPKIVEICKDPRHEVELYISYMVGNEANRNAITKYFLSGDYDYLLMIDTDQVPLVNPLDMLKHDKDVMSMPTILNVDGLVWGVYDKCNEPGFLVNGRTTRGEGIEKVYAVSTGCILIKRRVLLSLNPPFVPVRDKDDRRLVTQDMAFCVRCENSGFEVWVDWDRVCAHYKEINLTSI